MECGKRETCDVTGPIRFLESERSLSRAQRRIKRVQGYKKAKVTGTSRIRCKMDRHVCTSTLKTQMNLTLSLRQTCKQSSEVAFISCKPSRHQGSETKIHIISYNQGTSSHMTKERLGMPGPAQPCQNEKWLYRTGGRLGDEKRCGNTPAFSYLVPRKRTEKSAPSRVLPGLHSTSI